MLVLRSTTVTLSELAMQEMADQHRTGRIRLEGTITASRFLTFSCEVARPHKGKKKIC
jgi:hypothetical protein